MENKMDSMEKFYAKREEDFWTYYNKVKSYADNADVDVYQVVNFRQIFDQAYTLGALQNSTKNEKENN
jgi:Tfp pilus assembly protein PilE